MFQHVSGSLQLVGFAILDLVRRMDLYKCRFRITNFECEHDLGELTPSSKPIRQILGLAKVLFDFCVFGAFDNVGAYEMAVRLK